VNNRERYLDAKEQEALVDIVLPREDRIQRNCQTEGAVIRAQVLKVLQTSQEGGCGERQHYVSCDVIE